MTEERLQRVTVFLLCAPFNAFRATLPISSIDSATGMKDNWYTHKWENLL